MPNALVTRIFGKFPRITPNETLISGLVGYQTRSKTNWHESTVRRRVEDLVASGVLYFDLDVDLGALGVGTRAMLWMSVAPAKLMKVGQALARHSEVPFAAATTGSTNLVASVACRDDYALFEYLTREIAALDGVTHMETALIIRSIKQNATIGDSSSGTA
jgi:DNA-binding Lrp family transcriptional regulator